MRIILIFAILFSWLPVYTQNKMITIPGGKFKPFAHWERIPDEEKKVYDVKSFQLSQYEVTIGEFVVFLNEARPDSIEIELFCCGTLPPGIQFDKKTQNYYCAKEDECFPVTSVSWYGANAFCQWKGGRLPSEIEWLYAASGGKFTFPYKYSGSNDVKEVAVYDTREPQSVGSKKPNRLGIYDMSGNAMEWTNTSKESSIIFPYKKFVDEDLKVISCGSWQSLQDIFIELNNLSCFMSPGICSSTIGFRIAHE